MNFEQALRIIQDVQDNHGEGLLETLMYMQSNFNDFTEREQRAYLVVFANMRKLFVSE